MNYIFHILVIINIYIILSLSLNLLVGYTGLFSLCQAAFYGIGGYVTATLTVYYDMSFFTSLVIGIAMVIPISILISAPSIRLKGDYFILATLAFQIIVYSIFYNWISVTRGPYGIPGISKPSIFGLEFGSIPLYFILSLVFVIIISMTVWLLTSSPYGRVLKAIREDEFVTLSLGKNVTFYKISTFAFSASMAAVAGGLYSSYITYIDPTSFTLDESMLVLAMVIIGGAGNIKGPIIGAILLIILPEILRFTGIPDSIAPNVRQMIYGLLLILMMYFRPQGLAGEYKFE
jgi:branched-chain amino acid transport system permease protein